MIVLRTPKGLDRPEDSGRQTSGRLHGARIRYRWPICSESGAHENSRGLDESYKPEELFDENGKLIPELAELAPKGKRRMGANPHANGGLLLTRSADAGLPRLRGEGEEARAQSKPKSRAFWAVSCAT